MSLKDEVNKLLEAGYGKEDDEKKKKEPDDEDDLKLLLDDEDGDDKEEIKEQSDDDLFDKCTARCDSVYNVCDEEAKGDKDKEDECASGYNECGSDCEKEQENEEEIEEARWYSKLKPEANPNHKGQVDPNCPTVCDFESLEWPENEYKRFDKEHLKTCKRCRKYARLNETKEVNDEFIKDFIIDIILEDENVSAEQIKKEVKKEYGYVPKSFDEIYDSALWITKNKSKLHEKKEVDDEDKGDCLEDCEEGCREDCGSDEDEDEEELKESVKKIFNESEKEKMTDDKDSLTDDEIYDVVSDVCQDGGNIGHVFDTIHDRVGKISSELRERVMATYKDVVRSEKELSESLLKESKKLEEQIEVIVPSSTDFYVANPSPDERNEILWRSASEMSDYIKQYVANSEELKRIFTYEVPRKAEVLSSKLFDFILNELERS